MSQADPDPTEEGSRVQHREKYGKEVSRRRLLSLRNIEAYMLPILDSTRWLLGYGDFSFEHARELRRRKHDQDGSRGSAT